MPDTSTSLTSPPGDTNAAAAPKSQPLSRRSLIAVIVISLAVFMTSLDNLVVGVALPSIRKSLGGSIESLEWTVNAYTLTFAVTMIAMAALGDRFGRRRVFTFGIATFTLASAAAALAPSIDALVAARAIQGLGAAAIAPLSLALIAEAIPREKRAMAIGIWGGITGLGVALGPFVGGAVVQGLSWEWVFWLNVPIGILVAPTAFRLLKESYGPASTLDVRGMALVGAGLFLATFAVVRAPALGWGSITVIGSLVVGATLLASFIWWEARAKAPMMPLSLFRDRGFALTNVLSVAMFFGTFGSIFLLSQFFQTAQGYKPFTAGALTLPWTAMPMIVAPIAGMLYPRLGGRLLMTLGLSLQALGLLWLALVVNVNTAYIDFVPAFVMAGTGMALVFAPSASMLLDSVKSGQEGQASGTMNTLREIGGVLGVAVLATVFQAHGSYATPAQFTSGIQAALPFGVAVLALGALAAAALPAAAVVRAKVAAREAEGDAVGPPEEQPPEPISVPRQLAVPAAAGR